MATEKLMSTMDGITWPLSLDGIMWAMSAGGKLTQYSRGMKFRAHNPNSPASYAISIQSSSSTKLPEFSAKLLTVGLHVDGA